MIASEALGVVLVAAAAFGVLVCVRYLLFAWLFRDRVLALVAAAAVVVFAIAALLVAAGGLL